jgi:hypothetical protein
MDGKSNSADSAWYCDAMLKVAQVKEIIGQPAASS